MKTMIQRLKKAKSARESATGNAILKKDLAKAAGVTSAAVSNWWSNENTVLEARCVFGLAKFLEISPEWLQSGRGSMLATNGEHKSGADDAPISGQKPGVIKDFPTRGKTRINGETSGEPGDANVSQALRGHREIPILTLEQASKMAVTVDPYTLAEGLGTVTTYREVSPTAFAIPIKGPSMLPRFEDGDVVIIDPARPPKPGKFVLAGTHAGGSVFRKYRELGANDRGEMVFELAPLNDDFATLHSERDRLWIIGAMDAHINYDRDE